MAGIGFSLKKLFNKKGILNLCKAYGYAGVITTGPMLLGILLLVGIAFISRLGGMPTHDRELLNCMLTYGLLASLMVTSLFNMSVTRYISDCIYDEKKEKVLPSFLGSLSIMLLLCVATFGVFLIFAGISWVRSLLCLWFAMTLIVVWTEMIYMTALKDYKSIVLSFTISLMLGFLLALIFVLFGFVSIETMMFSMIVSYGILAIRYFKLLIDYFPISEGSHFSFLRWFDRYSQLALIGFLINIGLFSHLIIMYFGPLAVQVEGLFYGAPQYDVPAIIAFLSILITTVSFVVSVEVEFYPKYSNYYGLFNDKGAIKDIQLANKEMRTVLSRELLYLGEKQLFTTVLFIVLVPPLLQRFMPGISTLSLAIFRFLCVGYSAYAIANSIMLILLYFEDYTGALIGTTIFAVLSTVATIIQIIYGNKIYFGMGFFVGTIAFLVFSTIRLTGYTKRLPYYLLSRQSIVAKPVTGLFSYISEKLDYRYELIKQKKEEEILKKVREDMKGVESRV